MSDSIKGVKYRLDYILMRLNLLKKKKWKKIDPVFIVSTGRTGTKFLAHFFNKFEGVWGLHEPKPDFLKEGIDYAEGKLNFNKATKIIGRYRSAVYKEARRRNIRIYVEANNRLFSLIKPLKMAIPSAKIIHVVRDGRDYVRSGMSRRWYRDNDTTMRLKAKNFPKDRFCKQWEEMSRFEKIAWRWQKKDSFIQAAKKDMPDILTLKFEDIFNSKDYSGLKKIADYIGLKREQTDKFIDRLIEKKVNSTNKYAIKDWKNWTEDRKEKFYDIAGRHLKLCGYKKQI